MGKAPDISLTNHGSIAVLNPNSSAAVRWFTEHLPGDCQRWAGGYVVEPRYVDDIIAGAEEEGLTVG